MKNKNKSRDDIETLLVELQTHVAFQDRTIHELNVVITDQQRQIDQLNLKLKLINDKLGVLEEAFDSGHHTDAQEKPPHY